MSLQKILMYWLWLLTLTISSVSAASFTASVDRAGQTSHL